MSLVFYTIKTTHTPSWERIFVSSSKGKLFVFLHVCKNNVMVVHKEHKETEPRRREDKEMLVIALNTT